MGRVCVVTSVALVVGTIGLGAGWVYLWAVDSEAQMGGMRPMWPGWTLVLVGSAVLLVGGVVWLAAYLSHAPSE